ncbi:bridge-like lipid transfer protein family member 3B isoform X1 [Asterias amurensis]|uniref:bridge-like lipid transfer protein family member 3B isoform X1 n=1 Tax=Asterias amurensis TaxID=7602 RepID=UPI003AB24BC9
MASIIKGQIIKHLSKFAKNLSQDRIRLSTLKGEGNLTDLELDEEALMEVLEFPSWLVLNKVVCNKVSVKIPWTKLKTHPISIYLDQVELEMATCRTLRETTSTLQDMTNKQSQVPASRYGFPEKVVDGMYIHINSITGLLKSDTFHINLQIAQLIVQSTTPHWKPADLRYTRIKDSNKEQILTFKEVEWSTVRLTLDAIETDAERPTTPIRLITNQGKVRVTIKKHEIDCSLISSKLQMLLDDILWVLTDSQMKAVILHLRSLMPVIEKAANQSKARAADKGQPTASPSPMQDDSTNRTHNIKTHKELQNLQYFEKYDVQETSYHLFTRSIDLHLCDEMNQPEQEKFKRRIENGAMQIGLHGFSLDYYPFHTASSSREHWDFYDEAMKTSDKWIHTLLAHLKQQYKYAADYITKKTANKGPVQPGGQSSNKERTTPPPRPETGPKPKVQWADADQTKGHPQTKGHEVKGHQQTKMLQQQSLKSGQHVKGQPVSRQKSRVKLMSHSMVVRLRDFKVHTVAVGKSAGHNTKTNNFLFQSDKKTFFLPGEMPSIHIEYTSFYFPDELNFPDMSIERIVPSPIAYIQLNPVQFRLDYTSVLWLNQFSSNILQTLSDIDETGSGTLPEGKDHTDIRIDALMPKFILPAEVPVDGQPDRPPEVHVQMSQVTATNCRVGTGSSRPDLSHILQALHTKKLFMANSSFPSTASDMMTLPSVLWEHAYQPNYILPQECKTGNPIANGSLPNKPATESQVGSGVNRLTTYVFRPNAVDDVWNIKIEQIWADFHAVPSSLDRPIPLVDPIPLNLWTCSPRRTNDSQSQLRTQNGSCNNQAECKTENLKSKEFENTQSSRTDQSPPRAVGHKLIGRISANKNVADQTEQLKASLADNNQLATTANIKSPPQLFQGSQSQERSTQEFISMATPNSVILQSSTEKSVAANETLLLQGTNYLPSKEMISTEESNGSSCPRNNKTADLHIIAQTPSRIHLVLNHYQMLFLLRLQQSIQSLQQSMEADQNMFVSKDKPAPLISRVVAFEAPDILATLVMPPIPGEEDDKDDKEDAIKGDSSLGRTGTTLSDVGSTSDAVESNVNNKTDDKHLTNDERSSGAPDEGSPDSDIPTVEISDSSPIKDLTTERFQGTQFEVTSKASAVAPISGGPPGAVVVSEEMSVKRSSSISQSRLPSDSSTLSNQSQRRKSQEVLTSHSASGSPVFRNTDLGQPPRSSSQSDLARVHHTQMSFSTLQQMESNSSKASSLTSLDESVDLDMISLSSDSSEGFVMAVKTDGQSLGSSQGTETDSDIGQDQSKVSTESAEETLPAAPIEDYMDNKHKLKQVSVVTFHLIGVNAAVEINGSDIAVKADVAHLEREEKGNADYSAFMSTIAAVITSPGNSNKTTKAMGNLFSFPRFKGDRSKKTKVDEKKEVDESVKVPVALLRFQSGPRAEILSPGGRDRGFLQLQVCGLDSTFRMSTMTHLGSFVTDEVIGDAMPMSIKVFNSKIELMDDTPAIYPTHPGPQPMCLALSKVFIHRSADGVFHIEGVTTIPQTPSASTVMEDKTPTISPAQLEEENQQLISQVVQMKKALDVLENERSSLLGTLEHLQEELLTVDRERDFLRSSVTDLTRLLKLQR